MKEKSALPETMENLGHLQLCIPETPESMLLGSIHTAQDQPTWKNCLMLQYSEAVGFTAQWQSKWLAAASAKLSPSANLSLSKMSTVHTVTPCRYINTNPQAIYSKLY